MPISSFQSSNRRFANITVCAIYGHNDGSTAIPAILRSINCLPESQALLLSIAKPVNLPDKIQWQEILPMNYKQYSIFMMFCLQNFIETEYCITVQDDGWVLNGDNWNDAFWEYDYIGAPCHAAFVGNQLIPNYRWVGLPAPTIIQNGGFSLRSRKYLQAPSKFGVMYYFGSSDVIQNEDVQLTGIYRETLERFGIRFAKIDLAKYFSIEFLGRGVHDNLNFDNLFGLHGPIRKLTEYNTISYSISLEEAFKIYREQEVISHLKSMGYDIKFK